MPFWFISILKLWNKCNILGRVKKVNMKNLEFQFSSYWTFKKRCFLIILQVIFHIFQKWMLFSSFYSCLIWYLMILISITLNLNVNTTLDLKKKGRWPFCLNMLPINFLNLGYLYGWFWVRLLLTRFQCC